MTENSDLALETLLAVRAEVAPHLDEQLVRSCYAIQKKHQFDKDRGVAVQTMEHLIEEFLNKSPGQATKGSST